MIGIYFSGTGNSAYAAEVFMKAYNGSSDVFPIEDKKLPQLLKEHDELVISYPVQYSDVPKFLRDFVHDNRDVWRGKRIFIIATMALFSGDGAGVLGRLLKQYGAEITGGLHLQMPDSIADEKVLKRSLRANIQLVEKAAEKTAKAAQSIKSGRYPQEGLGLLSRLAGFLTQRLWFGYRTRKYSSRLNIDTEKCVGCSKCAKACPTQNIVMKGNRAAGLDRCTLCYRCVNLCPKQAITLLGKRVVEQTCIEKYSGRKDT